MTDWVAELKSRPLAEEVRLAEVARSGYRDHPVALDGTEQSEGCTDIRAHGIAGTNHYNTRQNPPYHEVIAGSISELYLRHSVAGKLREVNARLEPEGLMLWVYDAWRPIAVQNYFHDHWMPGYLKRAEPGLDSEALQIEVEKYWARGAPGGVVDPVSPPPHLTGGAVDLTLRRSDGETLFMGSIFDDVTAVSNTAHFEDAFGLAFSDIEARDNRRLLFWVMRDAGFANNPTEWWHFSYGDQMWARIMGKDTALYGPVAPTG
jgi:D-alanyl-D-alanine dipeptidase